MIWWMFCGVSAPSHFHPSPQLYSFLLQQRLVSVHQSFHSAPVHTSIYRSNQICCATTCFCRALENCTSHALSRTMLLASFPGYLVLKEGTPDLDLQPSKSPSVRAVGRVSSEGLTSNSCESYCLPSSEADCGSIVFSSESADAWPALTHCLLSTTFGTISTQPTGGTRSLMARGSFGSSASERAAGIWAVTGPVWSW